MRKVVLTIILVFGLGIVSSSCEKPKKENRDETQEMIKHEDQKEEVDLHEHNNELSMTVYQCPMKCEGDKTYNEKGSCPVCEMDLKEVEPSEIINSDKKEDE